MCQQLSMQDRMFMIMQSCKHANMWACNDTTGCLKNGFKNRISKFCAWFFRFKDPSEMFLHWKQSWIYKHYIFDTRTSRIITKSTFFLLIFTSTNSMITDVHPQTNPNQKVNYIPGDPQKIHIFFRCKYLVPLISLKNFQYQKETYLY